MLSILRFSCTSLYRPWLGLELILTHQWSKILNYQYNSNKVQVNCFSMINYWSEESQLRDKTEENNIVVIKYQLLIVTYNQLENNDSLSLYKTLTCCFDAADHHTITPSLQSLHMLSQRNLLHRFVNVVYSSPWPDSHNPSPKASWIDAVREWESRTSMTSRTRECLTELSHKFVCGEK